MSTESDGHKRDGQAALHTIGKMAKVTLKIFTSVCYIVLLHLFVHIGVLHPQVYTPLFATSANPLQLYHSPTAKSLAFKCLFIEAFFKKKQSLFVDV